jgi:hypothetical protein
MYRARTASVLPSFVSRGPYFLECDPAGSLSKFADTRKGPVDFLLLAVHFRDDPGNSAAMPGDDERLAAFHVIEQLGQVGLGFGSLNLTHKVLPD